MSNILEKGKELLQNAGSGSTTTDNATGTSVVDTGYGKSRRVQGGQEDNFEKALNTFEQKQGHPINSAPSENTSYDARNLFENATDRDAPSKHKQSSGQ
ncbi:hypothetical protein B0H19DRAFT_1272308 [Mycena capillaripes]|nr:hypothetical protein B0H19DRAFT_1272308 [Mycena capillaripes]